MSSNRVRPLSKIANLHRDLFHEFFRPTRELLERAIEYVEESVDGNVSAMRRLFPSSGNLHIHTLMHCPYIAICDSLLPTTVNSQLHVSITQRANQRSIFIPILGKLVHLLGEAA